MGSSLSRLTRPPFPPDAVIFANLGLGVFEQVFLVNQYGLSAADTGFPPIITGITGSLSFILASVSDKFNFCGLGHRLPYVLIGQAIAVASYVLISFFPPFAGSAGWPIYLASMAIRGFALSLAGSAMNGWIVDAQVRSRIGVIQAVRAIGTMLGLALVVNGGGQLLQAFNEGQTGVGGFIPQYTLYLACAVSPFVLVPLMLCRLVKEEKEVVIVQKKEPFDWKALSILATGPGIAVIVLTGEWLSSTLLPVF